MHLTRRKLFLSQNFRLINFRPTDLCTELCSPLASVLFSCSKGGWRKQFIGSPILCKNTSRSTWWTPLWQDECESFPSRSICLHLQSAQCATDMLEGQKSNAAEKVSQVIAPPPHFLSPITSITAAVSKRSRQWLSWCLLLIHKCFQAYHSFIAASPNVPLYAYCWITVLATLLLSGTDPCLHRCSLQRTTSRKLSWQPDTEYQKIPSHYRWRSQFEAHSVHILSLTSTKLNRARRSVVCLMPEHGSIYTAFGWRPLFSHLERATTHRSSKNRFENSSRFVWKTKLAEEPFALIEVRGQAADQLSSDLIHCQDVSTTLSFTYWAIGKEDCQATSVIASKGIFSYDNRSGCCSFQEHGNDSSPWGGRSGCLYGLQHITTIVIGSFFALLRALASFGKREGIFFKRLGLERIERDV